MALTPITATLTTPMLLTVSSYNDGIISFSGFVEATPNLIVNSCRKILNLVGLISGGYPARAYPMNIMSGSNLVFIVPSLWYGARQTQDTEYSDIEIARGNSIIGQIL